MDDPPDHVYDPIDHPDSYMSMLIGEGDSLAAGDWADIYASGDTWVKRLTGSDWSMDQGRVIASPEFPGYSDVPIHEDKFFVDTQNSPGPISKTFYPFHDGLWTVTLRIWDVGGGHEASEDSTYWHGSITGVGDQRTYVPELTLSRGRPNPSKNWVAWDLQLKSGSTVSMRVIGVDGRCVNLDPAIFLGA